MYFPEINLYSIPVKKSFLIAILLPGLLYLCPAQTSDTASTSANNASKFEFHVVEEGETVEDIARKYGVTVDQLKTWNDLNIPVAPGRILSFDSKYVKTEKSAAKAPQAPTVPVKDDSPGYHVVQAGETAYHISRAYNISVQQLLDMNHLSSPTIAVGQKLKVSSTAK